MAPLPWPAEGHSLEKRQAGGRPIIASGTIEEQQWLTFTEHLLDTGHSAIVLKGFLSLTSHSNLQERQYDAPFYR